MTKEQQRFLNTFGRHRIGGQLKPIGVFRMKAALLLGRRYYVPCSTNPNYDRLVRITEVVSNKEAAELIKDSEAMRVRLTALMLEAQ